MIIFCKKCKNMVNVLQLNKILDFRQHNLVHHHLNHKMLKHNRIKAFMEYSKFNIKFQKKIQIKIAYLM